MPSLYGQNCTVTDTPYLYLFTVRHNKHQLRATQTEIKAKELSKYKNAPKQVFITLFCKSQCNPKTLDLSYYPLGTLVADTLSFSHLECIMVNSKIKGPLLKIYVQYFVILILKIFRRVEMQAFVCLFNFSITLALAGNKTRKQ